jgi:hypothetical protein
VPRTPLLAGLALWASCFYVTEPERAARWDLDGDGVERPDDCDDADPSVAALTTFYGDGDRDGAGNPLAPMQSCRPPPDTSTTPGDCDDADPTSFPGAAEICDDKDNDCDVTIDEDLPLFTWYADVDGDGYGDGASAIEACSEPDGYAALSGDCDDDDPDVNPDAVEVCATGEAPVDEDCDNLFDEDDPTVAPPTFHADADGDGHGTGVGVATCDPKPDAATVGDDCDDTDPDVHPLADETCNGDDDDCDEVVDEDAVDAWVYYEDQDQDGWGNTQVQLLECEPPPMEGWALMPGDCADNDPEVNPGEGNC